MLKTKAAILSDLKRLVVAPPVMEINHHPIIDAIFPSKLAEIEKILAISNTQNNEEFQLIFNHKRNYKLGYYHEQLLNYWFQLHPLVDLCLDNFQIIENNRTIGAPDFLISSSVFKDVVHLEVALKFYLCHGDAAIPSHFIGPSGKDNLLKKLNKLRQNQLPLGSHKLVKGTFEGKEIVSCARIHGIMFYQLINGRFVGHPSPLFTDSHLKGWWSYAKHFKANFAKKNGLLFNIRKIDWFSSLAEIQDNMVELHFDEITNLCKKEPLHLAYFIQDKKGYDFISTGFVVDDNWPKLQL